MYLLLRNIENTDYYLTFYFYTTPFTSIMINIKACNHNMILYSITFFYHTHFIFSSHAPLSFINIYLFINYY